MSRPLGLPVPARSGRRRPWRVPASEVLLSPILVRPVREQLEHDRVIRLLQAKYKRKFDVAINPGNEQTAPVGPTHVSVVPGPRAAVRRADQEAAGRGRGRDGRVAEQPRGDVAVGRRLRSCECRFISTFRRPASTAPDGSARTSRFRPPRCGPTTRSASRFASRSCPGRRVRSDRANRLPHARQRLYVQLRLARSRASRAAAPHRRAGRLRERRRPAPRGEPAWPSLRSLGPLSRRRRPRTSAEPPRGRPRVSPLRQGPRSASKALCRSCV